MSEIVNTSSESMLSKVRYDKEVLFVAFGHRSTSQNDSLHSPF